MQRYQCLVYKKYQRAIYIKPIVFGISVFTMLPLQNVSLELPASCQYRYFTEGNLTLPFK